MRCDAGSQLAEPLTGGKRIEPGLSWEAVEGSPLPLGSSYLEDEQAWNFALYSERAARVALLIYGAQDVTHPLLTRELDYLCNKSGHVWHCRIAADEMEGGAYYAFQVSGPGAEGGDQPRAFDPEKILLDPYARGVFFPSGFDRRAATEQGSNAGKAPLGVLMAPPRTPSLTSERPRHDWDAVVYELHVRGFTMSPTSGLDARTRGTFAGVAARIPYLKELGVTAVELMPVFQYDPQGTDRWGYTPLSFFAPHTGYARRCDALRCTACRRRHRACARCT